MFLQADRQIMLIHFRCMEILFSSLNCCAARVKCTAGTHLPGVSESTSADAQLAVIQRPFMCMLPLRCPRYLTLFVCATSFRALTERIQVLEDKKGNVAAERIALERKLETERANQEDIFEYLRGEIHNKNNQITELQVKRQESLGHLPNSNELQPLIAPLGNTLIFAHRKRIWHFKRSKSACLKSMSECCRKQMIMPWKNVPR